MHAAALRNEGKLLTTSCVRDPGRYQEYKLGTERYGSWFDPAITVKDGKMSVPSGPGVGVKDLKGLLKDAKEVA